MAEIVSVINSSIRGYHFFRVTPPKEIQLTVAKEHNNIKDENEMIVLMPKLSEIPLELHDQVTRAKKTAKEEDQRVRDIEGKVVGRVPANLCREFRHLLDSRYVEKITCIRVGDPARSKLPGSNQKYRYNPYGSDKRGGGVLIPCKYNLYCYNTSKVEKKLETFLESFESTEAVLVEKHEALSCPL